MSPEIAADVIASGIGAWRKQKIKGQIAFFGGTFTGLSMIQMQAYLDIAAPYIRCGDVCGVRISTRPDCIDEEILSFLKQNGVTHIELGVQSLDDEVLRAAGRGYTAGDVLQSAQMIRKFGFVLGMQMMPGLPQDTADKSILTAQKIIELGAAEARIYPTVVIRQTPLEKMYLSKRYRPLSLDAAVDLCVRLKQMFHKAGVAVLKTGLHSGDVEQDIVAGPFHPAFGQLVDSKLCLEQMFSFCRENSLHGTTLYALPREFDVSVIVGQHRSNAIALKDRMDVDLKILKKVLTNEEKLIIL